MGGQAIAFTPSRTGKTLIIFDTTSVISLAGQFAMDTRFGTGTAPTAGAAATGTIISGGFAPATVSTANFYGLEMSGIATLTPGTTYWIDFSFFVVSGLGTITLANNTFYIVEF